MKIKEIEQEIKENLESLPQEVQDYISYLQDYNCAYFKLIIDTKKKLYNKEYREAENDLANVIFNGLNIQGYEQ